MPPINRIERGVLYATATPNRVVALQTAND
jgi:hypothetical protein